MTPQSERPKTRRVQRDTPSWPGWHLGWRNINYIVLFSSRCFFFASLKTGVTIPIRLSPGATAAARELEWPLTAGFRYSRIVPGAKCTCPSSHTDRSLWTVAGTFLGGNADCDQRGSSSTCQDRCQLLLLPRERKFVMTRVNFKITAECNDTEIGIRVEIMICQCSRCVSCTGIRMFQIRYLPRELGCHQACLLRSIGGRYFWKHDHLISTRKR